MRKCILKSGGDSSLRLHITAVILFYLTWILAPSGSLAAQKNHWRSFYKILIPRATLGDSDLAGWGWDLGTNIFYKPSPYPQVILTCSLGVEKQSSKTAVVGMHGERLACRRALLILMV